ncbi:hypothetical protein [Bosea sp. R86505]|uniref:hypothetical protein n=1 Tax=Bosea sp. R86505 TaxID=3101710 RepID=UPI00366CDABE
MPLDQFAEGALVALRDQFQQFVVAVHRPAAFQPFQHLWPCRLVAEQQGDGRAPRVWHEIETGCLAAHRLETSRNHIQAGVPGRGVFD